MPLNYLSSFTVVLRWIHGKVDICQTDYSIHSKLNIFPYSEVIHAGTTFRLTKGLQKLKKNDQLLNLLFLFFLSFFSAPMSQAISVINGSDAWCFLHASN